MRAKKKVRATSGNVISTIRESTEFTLQGKCNGKPPIYCNALASASL